MAIYALTDDCLTPVPMTNFAAENLHERRDIQQLLKSNISVLDENLMVIAEEFGEWLDSSRRIDLLCIDTDANLVVIELKRTDDGGHMELQALRYAAMISAMTFEQLAETHSRYCNPAAPDIEAAQNAILDFLGWDDPDEDRFGLDTRIILASANFSKELTTTVLWLRDREIDISCTRLQPYRLSNGSILLDVQPIIPLPETTNFQTQIGVKRQAERKQRSERHEQRFKFWEGLLDYARTQTGLHANRKPHADNWISGGIGKSGFSISYVVRQHDSQVELWIHHGKMQAHKNQAAFDQLYAQKSEIEHVFGSDLEWMPIENKDGCRIRHVVDGGWKTSPDALPETYEKLVSAMIRLDKAFRARVAALQLN